MAPAVPKREIAHTDKISAQSELLLYVNFINMSLNALKMRGNLKFTRN